MTLIRHLLPAVGLVVLWTAQLSAQGTITGRVIDSATQRPLAGATLVVQGTQPQRGATAGADGSFTIANVPAGARSVQASRVGYSPQTRQVTVTSGASVTAQFALSPQAVVLQELVAVGYGTQRREAVTGSVATLNAEEGNVGQITAPTQILQGRVAGVSITQNDGEPGSGVNVRIRGGTSISASNEPLYVIDGVPIQNAAIEPSNVGSNNGLARNPLNTINPSDIESISVLKDASSTAIYGSRGANGVVLITTKKGRAGRVELTYDGSVSTARPSKTVGVLDGDQYRSFIQGEVAAGRLAPERLANLKDSNTDWEDEVMRNAVSQNHTLAFSGGGENTQAFGSLSYSSQEGVVRSSGLERLAGRLNATQNAWGDRLRLGLNLNAAQVKNDYALLENTGGFIGNIFTNMVTFNPTWPVTETDPTTGEQKFYEIGPGAQSVRNPVAIAEQIQDDGISTRVLGNLTADLDILENLTAQLNVGTDRSNGERRAYYPKVSPISAALNGQAIISSRQNTTNTFQSYLTYRLSPGNSEFDVLGGYEYTDYSTTDNQSEAQNFITDAFGYYNLGAGTLQIPSSSGRSDSQQASFFTRANYSLFDRYFLTGVLRYDGSSRFGSGNKWALFPALSGSWLISDESWAQADFMDVLRLKVGYGLQGSQEISPYTSLTTLSSGSRTVFGEQLILGVAPSRNPNPDLRWEETAQWNVGLDYGFLGNRFSGTIDYYLKKTTDLLLTVDVPQPATSTNRLENVGSMKNQGVEFSLDINAFSRGRTDVVVGFSGSVDRNEVLSLGPAAFINTGGVSGQGQSGQNSQRIMPGYAIGTFFGPEYQGVDANGKQLFNKYTVTKDEKGNITSRTLAGTTTTPSGDDYVVIGDANPAFTLSNRAQATMGAFNLSYLVRGVFGQDVFNNTALVYSTKGNALQDKNFLVSALTDPIGLREPAIYSNKWLEDGSFVRLQNVTLGYDVPAGTLPGSTSARVYLSGDNLLMFTDYTGYDPETNTSSGLASRGIDYLNYPSPRTFTFGMRVGF